MINALAEACTTCYGNSDGGVINSSWEGSGKVTEKSLHLGGDQKFSQRSGGGAGIPGREGSQKKTTDSESAQAMWAEFFQVWPSGYPSVVPWGRLLEVHISDPYFNLVWNLRDGA